MEPVEPKIETPFIIAAEGLDYHILAVSVVELTSYNIVQKCKKVSQSGTDEGHVSDCTHYGCTKMQSVPPIS